MDAWRIGDTVSVLLPENRFREIEALRKGGSASASPKLSATVMLVREPCEVFLLRRSKSMAFVPDAIVFPGGGVRDDDATSSIPWAGPSPAEWAFKMGVGELSARGVISAAVRELFEECGVLLASRPDGSPLGIISEDVGWEEYRRRVERHEITFAEVFHERNLVMRTDFLGLRSRWITPEHEPRRYDAFFFAARVPPGQKPDGKTSEATEAYWANPRHVLELASESSIRLMPPTDCNLTQLFRATSIADFVRGVDRVQATMLRPMRDGDGRGALQCVLR